MIDSIAARYVKDVHNLQTPSTKTVGNSDKLFSFGAKDSSEDSNVAYKSMSEMSPLSTTVNSEGKPCTILSQKIGRYDQSRSGMVQDICNRLNALKSTLVNNKRFMPKVASLCSKIESKAEALSRSMDQALMDNTKETLSLHTCKTVGEVDDRMEETEAKLEAAYNEFCAKADVLSTLVDILPKLNDFLEANKGNGGEVQSSFEEIIDSIDVSNPNFSGAKNVDQIKEQSEKRVDELVNGDIKGKIEDILEKLEEKEEKKENKNFFEN